MEEYKRIIEQELEITGGFLGTHQKTIRERLLSAGKEMQGKENNGKTYFHQAELSAINRVIHLASTVVLLGSKDQDIRNAENKIRDKEVFRDKDPTLVLSMSALYYLIKDELRKKDLSPEEEETIEHVHRRFDELNWMITEAGMEELGLKAL